MKYTIDLILADAEGALERVLGRLRQRGFSLCAIAAGCSPEHQSIHARITIESTRPVEPLVKQLAKLFDVRYIALSSVEANISHVYAHNNAQEQFGRVASL